MLMFSASIYYPFNIFKLLTKSKNFHFGIKTLQVQFFRLFGLILGEKTLVKF